MVLVLDVSRKLKTFAKQTDVSCAAEFLAMLANRISSSTIPRAKYRGCFAQHSLRGLVALAFFTFRFRYGCSGATSFLVPVGW